MVRDFTRRRFRLFLGPLGRASSTSAIIAVCWLWWWQFPTPKLSVRIDGYATLDSIHESFQIEDSLLFRRPQIPSGFQVGPAWMLLSSRDGSIVAEGDHKDLVRITHAGRRVNVVRDHILRVIDGSTGRQMASQELQCPPLVGFQWGKERARCSGDGSRFAFAHAGVWVYDTSNAKLLAHLKDMDPPIDISHNGRWVAGTSSQSRSNVVIGEVASSQIVKTLNGIDRQIVHQIRFHPVSDQFIIQSEVAVDNQRGDQFFELRTIPELKLIVKHESVFTPWITLDGRFLCTVGRSEHVVLDITTDPPSKPIASLLGANGEPMFSSDGARLVISHFEHDWSVFDSANWQLLRYEAPGKLGSATPSHSGRRVVVRINPPAKDLSIVALLKRLGIQHYFSNTRGYVIDVDTGRNLLPLGDHAALGFSRDENSLWTIRHVIVGNVPSDTYIEQWSLIRRPRWWHLAVTVLSAVLIVLDLRYARRHIAATT